MLKEALLLFTISSPDPQLDCLTEAIYFEGRGESVIGQLAIANVILNRVKSTNYPNDVCSVVHQKHQFSYYWDGKSDKMRITEAYELANTVGFMALSGAEVHEVAKATHYHATYVNPSWSYRLKYVAHIGKHKFYEE